MITIATLVNEDDGTTTTVTLQDGGYVVRMRDDDSGNWLPNVSIYKDSAAAMLYAHRISGVAVA